MADQVTKAAGALGDMLARIDAAMADLAAIDRPQVFKIVVTWHSLDGNWYDRYHATEAQAAEFEACMDRGQLAHYRWFSVA